MTKSKLHSFEFCGATTQEKISQMYSHTSFESVDEILWYVIQMTSSATLSHGTIYLVLVCSFIPWFDLSNETSSAVLSHGNICLVCSSNF